MGNRRLLLLVLLASSYTFAQDDVPDNQETTCSKDATRFKHLRKYTYNYEAGTTSGVTGTADSQSGSKISCKVELEVPQPCNFILRTKQCTLREVYGVNSEGKALLKKSKNSEDLSNAMSKYEVKFTVPDGRNVILYPHKDEPLNVLNMKRGILSALLVPDETQESENMDTVYGKCSTKMTVTSRKGNIATDVTIDRKLDSCDKFTPTRDYVSPLALLKGLNAPLSNLISSSQTCQYNIEPKRKHVSEASCVETHMFLPFSYKNQYGMNVKVTQTLKLEDVSKTNNREFDSDPTMAVGLALEAAKSLSKNEDAVLANLMELQKLSTTEQNQQRASGFYKLVTALRDLNNDTLGPLVPKMIQLSSPIALQALTQCGTPECFGGILQVLRSGDVSPVISEAVTYTLGFLPSPCPKRVRELLNMAQYQPSRASFYALSHAVNNLYEDKPQFTPELKDVADFMISLIGNECTENEDKTFLTLKAIGIMGKALEAVSPELKSSLVKCVRSQAPSFEIRKAAIQAFRKMNDIAEVRDALVQAFQETAAPVQNRLAAYLLLMKDPTQTDLRKIIRVLAKEENVEVKTFVASHMKNILDSQELEDQKFKDKIKEALKNNEDLIVSGDNTKVSRNYKFYKSVNVPGLDDSMATKVEGNLIFDTDSSMPKEAMLEATLNVFGQSIDMFEFGVEGKGFEPTLDALFGKSGFFPDTTMKALYWVDGKVPDKVTEVLYKWFGVSRQNNQNKDFTKAVLLNVEKLIKEVRSSDAPEAKAYLDILGKELGYLKLSDFKILGNMLLKTLHTTQELPVKIMQAISKGAESDLFLHYIFMDNEFELPTGSGLQLQVSLSGIIAPGTRAGMKIGSKNMKAELSVKPAVSVEFVTQMGVKIPEFSRHAVIMNSNIYHESGIEAHFSVKDGQFKFSIPAPKAPTKLLSINNKINLVFASKTEVMTSIIENREERSSCKPLLSGLNYCTNVVYSNASSIDGAPYFPLTGEARYDLEIQPTGEVEAYSVTADYKLNREGEDMVDTLTFSTQAEGTKSCEATLTMKYNRNKVILTSDVQIPKFDVDFGVGVKLNDESTESKKLYSVVIDVHNQQVQEGTLTGQLSYDGKGEAVLGAMLSIPRLDTEAKTEATVQYVAQSFKLQLQSSAQICAFSGSQKVVFTYDHDKVELEWNAGTNSNVQKIVSKIPDIRFSDLSNYPETLKKYANDALDYKVAQTDMTMRHIVSQSLVATSNWLRDASKDIPYAVKLHNKLTALQELDLQGLGLPPFPEQLFLNSNGRIKYLLNKDSIIINIPLPYGGKSSEQLMASRSMRSPPVDLPSVGLKFPSREFKIPAFTIPEYYQLKVPLLGVLELSSNFKSNYYNWSASYVGGNTTTSDVYTFISKYEMQAASILDILSYNIDGSALSSYDPKKTLHLEYTGSVRHSLLDFNIRFSDTWNFQSNQIFKGSHGYDVKSILGVEASVTSTAKTSKNNNIITSELNNHGQYKIASLFANSDYMMMTTFNTDNFQVKTESNFNLDSSYIKIANKMSGLFLAEAITITSTTDVQDGALSNTMTVDYRNRQLSFKSDTNGNYYNLIGMNKFEFTLSKKMAAIRSEYQADYKRNRFYTLLSGSLNSLGLELNADVSLNNQANRAAHKATMIISQDGLSTSATTNVNFSPLTLENEFNAGIGASGATMKMTANGRYREHNAKVTIDGKAALTELSFGSVYQATILGLDSKNVLIFRFSKEGLKFSNNLMGSYEQMRLENNNDLSIADYSIHFNSKFENTLRSGRSYKQDFDLKLQPYTITALLNNEFQFDSLELTNRGQFQLEDLKINLNGNMRGAINKDEVKHSYTSYISYAQMLANLKMDTVANIQGTAHTHTLNMEIAGLSASFSSSSNCETKSMRFTNMVRSVIAPFTVTIDAHTTGDGRLYIYGEHTGQLYSKFILKAEPLSFNLVHDYRGSTGHTFEAGKTHSTLIDYKMNVLFTPSEQLTSWKLKSQLNQNTYTQDLSAYNNPEKVGVELSGQTLADLSILDRQIVLPFSRFNPIDALGLRDSVSQPQEFSISGYVKYDKNKDMHTINLPFIESLSSLFEKLRSVLLTSLQGLHNSLKSVNIDQYIRNYKKTLDKIPQQMNDYINNLDIEGRVNEAKENILSLTKEFKITSEELQIAIERYFKRLQVNLQMYLSEIDNYVRENYNLDQISATIEMLIKQIIEKIKAFEKQYSIREKTVEMIKDLQNFVEQININELGKDLASYIQSLEDTFQIKVKLQKCLQKLQALIQKIDIDQMAENAKQFLQTIEINKYVEQLKNTLPIKHINYAIEQIKNLFITLLEEYEISEKINALIDKLQDIITEYDIDKKLQILMEKFIQLLNQQKVKETITKITNMLNGIDIKLYFKKLLTFIEDAVKQVKEYNFRNLINDINNNLNVLVRKMKSFNYDKFVDDVNNWIREVTLILNNKMKALDLPQKAEALKQYMNDVRTVVNEYIQQLKDTKFSSVVQWYQDVMSSTILNELKTRTMENLQDARDRIYSMNIKKECQRYLQQVSQAYNRIVTYISQQWEIIAEKINNFAAENNLQELAKNIKTLVEEGFVVPEINSGLIYIPTFEVSLRALKEATFKTPSFVVPLTDLHIPSVEINFKTLKEIEIPTRFVTPEFTVLSTFKVPSYVIDLNEIKLKIVRTIDQITSSDFQWPSPEVYFKDLRMSDMAFPEISFPQIYVPDMQIPEITIPKLNLKNFQFADIQIPEFNLPQIPHTVSVPAFGKFSSSLKVTSPFFTMTTVAEIRNDTISENNPEFVASLSTETTSVMEAVSFTLLADARISAPMVEQLLVKESVLLSNKYVKLDHNSELTFSGSQIQTKAETKANLNTEKNSVEFHNDILLKLQKRITAECNTKYSHRINIPQYDISSQLGLQNEIQSIVEAGRILLISSGKGNWKWACPIFTDEGNHQADLKFNLKGSVIEISGTNTINDKYLKLDQSLKYESALFNYVNVDIISKAESTYVGNSIVSVKGSGQLTDLKLELIANHNAELFGRATGTISNGLSFLVKPFEINFSSNNNGNLKVSFPLKLTGKIEFLNNYNFILNSKVQQVSWQVNGRFNQYKVSHTISAGNNEESVEAVVAMNGEANLDFLTIPISIPQIPVPYTAMKTPEVKEFSLWERTGLKNFLKTTKQNFDLNVKLQYKKNKDMHSIPLPLDEIYGSINSNMKTISKKFEKGRDNVLNILMDSYNQAKVKFDKYKVENSVSKVPRTFRIPGYTIPLVNIEVSPFSAELPAFGYVIPKEISTPSFTLPVLGFSIPTYTLVLPSLELPVLHVPNTLRRLTLPKFKLPSGQNSISIPAMGNLTYDFSFKSNVISVTTSAGLYNQSDISARISVASTSVIDALQFNIDGTTGLTRKRGLKLATALALKTVFIEGKHESSMSLGKRNVEASVTTNGKMNIPLLKLTFNQELTGNTKTKPTLSSKMTLSYDFNDSKYGNNAKGTLDHTLSLESLTSYFSLETVTNGDTTGTLLSNQFSGKFTNEANTYLNSNGVRSSVKLVGSSKVDSFGTLDIAENLAVEATTSRIYAVWEHTGENYLRFTPLFITRGTQNSKATLELALWSLLANLNLKISQPNSYFADTALNQDILLSVNTEKQEFGLNGQGILETIVLSHNFKLSNDKTDARVEVDGSLQGHVDFLKSVILPVYEKSLWDVLKFDLTTSADKKQYLKASTSLIYTKNKEGFFFPIPINKMADGFTITFPALALNNIKIQKKLSTLPFDLSLPSLPQVKFPKIDITTKYIIMEEYKIPFFEVTIPKHQITLARYTLPKSFYNLDFNTLMNKIADIDLPTIEIPEQNIEIPPVKLNLPAGLFIPAFGTLTGSAQLSSPIYNVSWTAKLANSSEGFVASIDATSSSTLRFLEYDLDASASTSLKGSTLSFKGAFAHPDLSADWQNDIFFNGLRMPGHNIEIDIRSPTFTNVQIRCQQENNKMSSTVTCPSVGTLGLVLEKDATTLKGKLFSRSVANPAKDTLIMKSEMSLKNPGKIQNKINWKEDAAMDVLNGLKEKLPKMTDAIYNGINKYHKEHLGMEMSDARLKMKESLQNSITATYRSTANQIDRMEYNLRTAARGAGDKYMDIMYNAQNWYKGPADMPDFMNDVEFKSKFYDKSIMLIRSYQNTMKDLIDAAIAFVKNTQFQLPGQSEKYTGEELFTMGMKKVMSSIEQSMQEIQLIFDKCIQSINDMQLNVPGTDISIQGKQVISAIKNLLIELQRISRNAFADLQNVSLEKILKQLKSLIQEISQESEKIIESLKSRNYQDIKAHAQKMYRDAMDTEYAREISNVADKLQRIAIQMQKHFQAAHEQVSEKLEQLRIYAKALREEYLDPNIVGWSVKYYEIEEKVIQLLKAIIDSLKELPSKYGINVPEMTENAKEFVIKYYQHASNLVTNKDDQGRQLIIKLSRHIEGNIAYLSASARKFTEERTEILRAKVQDAYGQLVNSYDKFIVEANRLIDLAIEKYNSFIEFIAQLLQNFQNSTSDEMKKYVSTRKGELKVDVPHPFDWNSFDEMPQLRSDIVNKRLEIARSMVFDGIDKGSKTWEELQHFIEKQLEDGKLSAQQIIENIRNWKKN